MDDKPQISNLNLKQTKKSHDFNDCASSAGWSLAMVPDLTSG
jgi:hypothetical protein